MIRVRLSRGYRRIPLLDRMLHLRPQVPSPNSRIDLWLGRMEGQAGFQGSTALLSRDEEDRAGRFHREIDRRRFVWGRAQVRSVLGSYLSIPPEGVAFRYSDKGKPELHPPCGLDFSVSHSENLLLVGVGEGLVGVDVEVIGFLPDLEAVASMAFTEGEMEWLRDAPEEERPEAFFRLWTGKEALLKALGVGFSMDPREVELEPEPGRFRACLGAGPGTAWSITSFIIRDKRAGRRAWGAVAVSGSVLPSLALRSLGGRNGLEAFPSSSRSCVPLNPLGGWSLKPRRGS
jgi:4'-phosphopantetheinyl transferase